MTVRKLLPFIDNQQEVVIIAEHGGNALSGTALDIHEHMKEAEEFLNADIKKVYTHFWKLYIIVEFYKEMNIECECKEMKIL